MPNQVTNFLFFGALTVLSMQALFLDCLGFLATGVVAGISSLPSVDLIVFVTCIFDPKDRNFLKSNCFSCSFFFFIPNHSGYSQRCCLVRKFKISIAKESTSC